MNHILVWCKCNKVVAAYGKDSLNDPKLQTEIKYYKHKGYKVKFGTTEQVKNDFGCICKNKKP